MALIWTHNMTKQDTSAVLCHWCLRYFVSIYLEHGNEDWGEVIQ